MILMAPPLTGVKFADQKRPHYRGRLPLKEANKESPCKRAGPSVKGSGWEVNKQFKLYMETVLQ
jgi:hypothetical protein